MPGEYRKAELSVISKDATYEGNKKWKFTALLHGEEVSIEQEVRYRDEDKKIAYVGGWWFYRAVITEYDLAIWGNYYERVNSIEIVRIDRSNIEITKNDWKKTMSEALE